MHLPAHPFRVWSSQAMHRSLLLPLYYCPWSVLGHPGFRETPAKKCDEALSCILYTYLCFTLWRAFRLVGRQSYLSVAYCLKSDAIVSYLRHYPSVLSSLSLSVNTILAPAGISIAYTLLCKAVDVSANLIFPQWLAVSHQREAWPKIRNPGVGMSCTTNLLSSLTPTPDLSLIDLSRWYAVYTYPRHEKSVMEHFESKSLEAFLPTFVRNSRWKDRRVCLKTPAFPSYVFIRINASQRNRVLNSPGVIRILSSNGMPTPIDDAEIESVKLCLERASVLGPCPFLEVGDRVRVKSGVLEGLEGHISRRKNDRRLIVPITLIHQSVAIEIDVQLLELITAETDDRARHLGHPGLERQL